MNTKYRINRDGVHLSSPLSDYTLCGDTDDGDTGKDLDIEPLRGTQQRIVTCPRCVRIISHCKNVKTSQRVRALTANKGIHFTK